MPEISGARGRRAVDDNLESHESQGSSTASARGSTGTAPTATAGRSTASATVPSRRATAQHDANLRAYAHHASAEARTSPKPNDAILYVGMNGASAGVESAALARSGAKVSTVARHDGSTITCGGRRFDLANDAECDAFARSLASKNHLPPTTTTAITKALLANPPGGRDELAGIAKVFAEGEAGKAIPSRIVLSGHSDGKIVYGNDAITYGAVRALGAAMPKAAAQIEDIHISGCFTNHQVEDNASWRQAFPNLKSMWGYAGFAPAAPTGHLQTWERTTRGRADGDPNRGIRGVATWASHAGVKGSDAIPLARLQELRPEADARFDGFVSGADRVRSAQDPRAFNDYQTYRSLSLRPEYTSTERAGFAARANALQFVRHYESGVRTEFARAHGATVFAGLRSVGLPGADFSKLTRAEAMATIRAFEHALEDARPVPPAAAKAAPILRDLAELREPGLRRSWCH